MTRVRHHLAAAVVAAVLAAPFGAAAQGDAAGAEFLFQEGREAMARGEYTIACEKFAASYQLDAAAGTMINLAACFEERQMTASAWEAWQRALQRLSPEDDRRPVVEQRLSAAAAHLARLTIDLDPAAPPGTVVTKDGVTLATAALGAGLPVDPGDHRIEVRAPGHEPREYRVHVDPESTANVAVAVGPAKPVAPGASSEASTATPPAATSRHPGRALRRAGWVIGSVGVAGLAAGAGSGLLAWQDQRTMDDECVDAEGTWYCSDRGLEASDQGDMVAPMSSVAFAVGGAALLGGTLLIAVGRHRERVAFTVAPTTASLALGARLRF